MTPPQYAAILFVLLMIPLEAVRLRDMYRS